MDGIETLTIPKTISLLKTHKKTKGDVLSMLQKGELKAFFICRDLYLTIPGVYWQETAVNIFERAALTGGFTIQINDLHDRIEADLESLWRQLEKPFKPLNCSELLVLSLAVGKLISPSDGELSEIETSKAVFGLAVTLWRALNENLPVIVKKKDVQEVIEKIEFKKAGSPTSKGSDGAWQEMMRYILSSETPPTQGALKKRLETLYRKLPKREGMDKFGDDYFRERSEAVKAIIDEYPNKFKSG